MKKHLMILVLVGVVGIAVVAWAADIDLTIKITIKSLEVDAVKELLDEKIDPDNAGGDYQARFKDASTAAVLEYWRTALAEHKRVDAVNAAIDAAKAEADAAFEETEQE